MKDAINKSIIHLQSAIKLLQERQPKQKSTIKVKDFDPMSKKAWFKMIKLIDDPHFCETLIIQPEARKLQLKPDFKSETTVR